MANKKDFSATTSVRYDRAENLSQIGEILMDQFKSMRFTNKYSQQAAFKFAQDIIDGNISAFSAGKIDMPGEVSLLLLNIISPENEDGTRKDPDFQNIDDVKDPDKILKGLGKVAMDLSATKAALNIAKKEKNMLVKKNKRYFWTGIAAALSAVVLLGTTLFHGLGWKNSKSKSYDAGYDAGKNAVDITVDNDGAYDTGFEAGKNSVKLVIPGFERNEGESDEDYLKRYQESDNDGPLVIEGFERNEGESDEDYLKRYQESDNDGPLVIEGFERNEGESDEDYLKRYQESDNTGSYNNGYKDGQNSVDITTDNDDVYKNGYEAGKTDWIIDGFPRVPGESNEDYIGRYVNSRETNGATYNVSDIASSTGSETSGTPVAAGDNDDPDLMIEAGERESVNTSETEDSDDLSR